MATTLYHNQISPHCRRVVAFANEVNATIDYKTIDIGKGEHKEPTYLKKNPNGKVPTLDDNGYVLWESNAILQYLADKTQGTSFYPTDAKERANVNHWLFWESAQFGTAALGLTFENVIKPMMMKQEPNATIVASCNENFARYAAVLNGHLETNEYVCGKNITIADFALASDLTYAVQAKIDIKPYKSLQNWYAKIESRDSWKKTAPKF